MVLGSAVSLVWNSRAIWLNNSGLIWNNNRGNIFEEIQKTKMKEMSFLIFIFLSFYEYFFFNQKKNPGYSLVHQLATLVCKFIAAWKYFIVSCSTRI